MKRSTADRLHAGDILRRIRQTGEHFFDAVAMRPVSLENAEPASLVIHPFHPMWPN
jgi:hypothetical protein